MCGKGVLAQGGLPEEGGGLTQGLKGKQEFARPRRCQKRMLGAPKDPYVQGLSEGL